MNIYQPKDQETEEEIERRRRKLLWDEVDRLFNPVYGTASTWTKLIRRAEINKALYGPGSFG